MHVFGLPEEPGVPTETTKSQEILPNSTQEDSSWDSHCDLLVVRPPFFLALAGKLWCLVFIFPLLACMWSFKVLTNSNGDSVACFTVLLGWDPQSLGPGARRQPTYQNITMQGSAPRSMLCGSRPNAPHCPCTADPTYFMGSEAFSGLSRLIKSLKNELAQQTLSVINKHGQRERERDRGDRNGWGVKVH